jgi:type VI secretion system protein ImpL
VSDLLESLLWSPGFMLGLIALLALPLALLLVRRLGRARDAASYTPLGGAPAADLEYAAEGSEEPPPPQVVDLRGAPRSTELKRTFARVARLTESPGAGRSGRLPWFLCLGATGAGKSTLLGHSDLRLPYGEPEAGAPGGPAPACRVWIFDSAVMVEPAGDLVLPAAGVTADRGSWLALLAAQRAARPRRPADGVLLVLPVPELLAAAGGDATALRLLGRRADRLRRHLEQAQRAFGFRLPVSVVLAKCDLVPGFGDLQASLPAEQRRQIFGWSNPYPADTAYSGSWPDDALAAVGATLIEQQLRVLAEGRPLADPRAFAALPATFDSLTAPLRTVLNRIFSGGPSPGAAPLRGVYLTAGEGFDDGAGDAHHRVDFVADLLPAKVFADWDLARPEPELEARRRRLLAVARVLLAVLVIAGPLTLAVLGWQLHRQARLLDAHFAQPAMAGLTTCRGRDCPEATRELLAGVDQVPDYRLRYALLPASWRSRLARCTETLGLAAYQDVVFPTLRTRLDRRSEAVVAGAVAPPLAADQRIYDVATVPAFSTLSTMMGQLDGLEDQVARYQRFTGEEVCWSDARQTVENFASLTGYLLAVRPRPPTGEARGFLGDVLCEARPAPYSVEVHRGRVDRRADELGRRTLADLFQRNALIEDLQDLETQIGRLSSDPPSPAQARPVYETLVDAIDRTESDLADPRLAWAGKATVDLGNDWTSLLGAISESAWTGYDEARVLQAAASAGFATLRTRLRAAGTPATGPLLARDGEQVLLRLSPSVLGLRAALLTLLDRYVKPLGDLGWTYVAPAGTWLSWDALPLTTAADTLDGYDAFVLDAFGSFPTLRPALTRSTRDRVELQVLATAAGAQRFPPEPDLATAEQIETQLDGRVSNLLAAAGPLNRLLTGLTKPPSARNCPGEESPYCALVQTLAVQQTASLGLLDRLLAARRLYEPVTGGVARWNGGGNLAWSAFGVTDAKGLEAYVAAQRGVVTDLDGRYATPILTAVPVPDAVFPRLPAPQERWSLLRSDLAAYQNKAADNPLARLEGFITGDMATASLDGCLAVDPSDTACLPASAQSDARYRPPPCDFFLTHRNRLVQSTAAQCETATLATGTAAYAAVADAFDALLAGRYPFAAASARLEATPDDLASFFAVHDARRPQVERMLEVSDRIRGRQPASLPAPPEVSWPQPPWTPAIERQVGGFLAALGDVRSFFQPYLDAVAAGGKGPPPVPSYAVEVDLRPYPEREPGGNQLIRRSLSVDGSTVRAEGLTPTPAGTPVSWSYGSSLRLTFSWARDGWYVPESAAGPYGRVEDRDVVYEFPSPWSLLRLLDRPSARREPGVLVFRVETARAPAPPPPEPAQRWWRRPEPEPGYEPPQPATVEVLVEVVPRTPDETMQALAVPDFPTAAPAAPAALPGLGGGAAERTADLAADAPGGG